MRTVFAEPVPHLGMVHSSLWSVGTLVVSDQPPLRRLRVAPATERFPTGKGTFGLKPVA